MKGCVACKNRRGINCLTRHKGKRIMGVLKVEDVGKIYNKDRRKPYRAGCKCPEFTPKTAVPIVVIFNGEKIFDGETIFERKN